jgi:hypothetical protein
MYMLYELIYLHEFFSLKNFKAKKLFYVTQSFMDITFHFQEFFK